MCRWLLGTRWTRRSWTVHCSCPNPYIAVSITPNSVVFQSDAFFFFCHQNPDSRNLFFIDPDENLTLTTFYTTVLRQCSKAGRARLPLCGVVLLIANRGSRWKVLRKLDRHARVHRKYLLLYLINQFWRQWPFRHRSEILMSNDAENSGGVRMSEGWCILMCVRIPTCCDININKTRGNSRLIRYIKRLKLEWKLYIYNYSSSSSEGSLKGWNQVWSTETVDTRGLDHWWQMHWCMSSSSSSNSLSVSFRAPRARTAIFGIATHLDKLGRKVIFLN